MPAIVAVLTAVLIPPAMGSTVSTVPVHRCPTVFGVPPGRIPVPARIPVLGGTLNTGGLTAYSNTRQYLIGPAGLQCAGTVGADGTTEISVWNGQRGRPPVQHSGGAGLTLFYDPDCSGCEASDACPFFMAFASALDSPCPNGIPKGETVQRRGSNLALFSDPAKLAGDGWPSGGSNPAKGVVGIHGRNGAVYRATCTLPASQHAICTVSLNNVIARYG